jgi:photosystem II stability/assembly factor-like uncharacterized protein
MKRLLCLTFLCAIALAEHYDASVFGALQWRSIGPQRGGRSITSASSVARPNEYYFGAVGGGLWKTTDGGTTWRPVTDGQLQSSSVGAVAVAESNPDVVYLGMGETELRGNIMQGDGVYKSIDAGKTWKHIGLGDTQAISRIRVDPSNADVVYVSALGHPYAPNAERGVFRSRDGGKTWQKILYKSDKAGAVDLCIDPHNSKVLFAALWDVYRTSWTLSSGGPLSGLYKSTDGGDTWTEITRRPGLPNGIIGKIGVAVSSESSRIYAMVEAEDGGLFRSEDGGATWARISEDRKLRQRAFYYSRIYADPKERDIVYVLNTSFFKSTDGGKTFKAIRTPHGDNHDLWIAANDPKRMIESNDGGANVSINGGETWTGQDFPTAQLYHVTTTRDVPYHVCGAQQDNTTICVSSAAGGRGGGGGGARIAELQYSAGGGESGYIATHPANPNIFYAGSQGALLTRLDRATGQMRDVEVYPLFFSGMPASALKERWQWTFPIVFSPLDPKVIYTSSQHLWKTTNEGQSWEAISPDLTRADPKTLGDSGGPITKDQNGPEIYGTIFSIAPSHTDAQTIWTGSDDGMVYITRDGGKNWKNITPPGIPDFIRISLIEASPHKPGTAYVAAKHYQADDRRPYAYRTDDYGATWTKIVNGIPASDFFQAIREDPKRAGLLYAGTEHGIYVSFDNGAEWQSLRLNLPDTQVSDLLIEGDDLVIATHGRSFYILDDITPLRQLSAGVLSTGAHLFTPHPVIRSVNRAGIDYWLAKEADTVKIDILDSTGAVVRSYVGSAEEEKKSKTREEKAAEEGGGGRGGPVRPPARKAGGNRFTWDLRYPGAKIFEGMIFWSAPTDQGPTAAPGQYQVRLTANGVTEVRALTVTKDPRLTDVSDGDLAEQFKLAMEVRDKTSEANEMVIRIREIKKNIADRVKKDPSLDAAGERLSTKLSAVEEDIYQVRNRSNQDPLNFPIKLNNQIAALMRVVETGDAKPTDQSYAVFKELNERLEAIKKRYEEILKSDTNGFTSVEKTP